MKPKPKAAITDDTRAKAQARIDAENAVIAGMDWTKVNAAMKKLVKSAVLKALPEDDLVPDAVGLTPLELLLVERLSEMMLRAMLPAAVKAIARSATRKPRMPRTTDLSMANYSDLVRAYDDLGMTAARGEVHAAAWKIAGKALAAARKRRW